MESKNVFQELSHSLSEPERKDLLDRIKQSIDQDSSSDEPLSSHEMGKEEREQLLLRDLDRASWVLKFMLWFKSKLSGKSLKNLFINAQLKRIKRYIAHKYPGITGFETRDLSPKLATEIFGIYTLTLPLKSVFSKLWSQRGVFEKALLAVIELKLADPKRSALDFLTMEQMEEIYAKTNMKDKVRDELDAALNRYIDSIPADFFATVEKGVIPLHYLKELILYPYASFFQLFHFTPVLDDENAKTYFKSASAMIGIEHLQKMTQALWMAAQLSDSMVLDDNMAIYIDELNRESAAADNIADESAKAEGIVTQLNSLAQKATSVYNRIPLIELIRFFLRDPYHDLSRELPSVNPEEFYRSFLKILVMGEFDTLFSEVKRSVIEKEIAHIFRGKKTLNFRNYREYASIDYDRLGLPFFKHTRSMTLIFNYIKSFYKGYVQEAVQILERGILTQNRITRERLQEHASVVEDLVDKITQFDYSLSPDSDDGKLFQRLRFTLASDPSHQRMYRTLVTQKDREVQSVLERGLNSLEGLGKVFSEILSSPSSSIQQQLNNHYYVKGKALTLSSIIKTREDHLSKFRNLLSQIIKIEGD